MIKRAFIRANIPFIITSPLNKDKSFISSIENNGWFEKNIQGDFLLKHINTTFSKNVNCYVKQPINLNFSINYLVSKNSVTYTASISKIEVYCFETGIGILSFHIPYDNDIEEAAVVNTCSILRCCVEHEEQNKGISILINNENTYLSTIAEKYLNEIFETNFSLFDMFNKTSLKRIDMFSAVLCDKNESANAKSELNELCYRLSNTYDNRDQQINTNDNDIIEQHDYIRWGFSKRGCAAVSNLTQEEKNNNHLLNRWFVSVETNYFYLFLLVLHEKFAIYSFLNNIAEDPNMHKIQINQEELLNFNSKYIFKIISDEQFIQKVYLKFKTSTDTDDLYLELLDQLKHMFDFEQLNSNKDNEKINNRLNFISVIISAICYASIILDSISLFSNKGCSFGFNSMQNIIYSGTIILETIVFLIVLLVVLFINKKKKSK